jgi:hypothetical protein
MMSGVGYSRPQFGMAKIFKGDLVFDWLRLRGSEEKSNSEAGATVRAGELQLSLGRLSC